MIVSCVVDSEDWLTISQLLNHKDDVKLLRRTATKMNLTLHITHMYFC